MVCSLFRLETETKNRILAKKKNPTTFRNTKNTVNIVSVTKILNPSKKMLGKNTVSKCLYEKV